MQVHQFFSVGLQGQKSEHGQLTKNGEDDFFFCQRIDAKIHCRKLLFSVVCDLEDFLPFKSKNGLKNWFNFS